MRPARNIAILMLIALAVVALPGGGSGAALVGAILSLLFVSLLTYLGGRFYRDHQLDIYGLGDSDRAILYVSVGAVAVIAAGTAVLFGTPAGTLATVAVLAACVFGLVRVFRNWQRY